MSFNDEYLKLRKKRLEEEETRRDNTNQNKVYLDTLFPDANSDIAPVRLTEQEQQMGTTDERKWFQKGAFEDGYQFGDLIKTIDSSAKDAETNVMAGILGIGEKVFDAGAYIVGGIGGLFSKDFQNDTKDFIAKDLYDEEEIARKIVTARSPVAWVNKDIMDEENSVLGEKTDALAQSGGQLLGTMALQSVGVPWYLTSGVTSFGAETENAFNQGATYGQAGLSAAITAGVELATEKLFGGSGLGEKGLINLDGLTKGISNKVGKALLDFGIDMTGEGVEEIASQIGSNFASALYSEKNLQELLLSEEAFDEYLESFIGGMALGGVANVGKVGNSIKTGRDYRTGLTESEQKVFDNVYNKRVAEAQEGGKELSKKEKDAIYDAVMKDLEKGRIDINTIEETLGEDVYKSYKDTIDYEDDILKQYEELGKKTNPTLAEMSLYDELKSQYNDIKQNSQREAIKSRLSKEVFGKVKDTKLAESYAEEARWKQKFEADLSQYDEKQQDHVKRALESGVLNNRNSAHDIVGLTAKIEADKGVRINYVNDEIIKDMGVYVEGVDNNGFVKDGVLYINVDSPKYLNFTVGHEITHTVEQAGLYAEMQKALFDVAKAKGEYDSRLQKVTDTYKKYDPKADPVKELTADLVGDYLFTDENFVKRLSTEHRNVFQKMWDEIKHLWKMATAGSKEARELEKAMHLFEKVYRESGKAQTEVNTDDVSASDTKYSLTDSNGKQLTKGQQEYFKDSKMRDENGNLKVMYHGTPNGDFSVFKDGTYFTEHKWYADRYQNPGASSISTGKVATNPKTFEVYLDIKKPFDINDAEARSIYINDYIKGGNAVGINPYLSDAEYRKIDTIDWTEGEDLREFLIDNGYDYDGLVLDEGAVGGYGEDVTYRGKSYVVFSPEQVKNVDNFNPTRNPDIRYSLTEYTAEEKKAHNDAVVEHFGKTYKWAETGYLLLDGTKLDLSGKHDGAPGGYRTVDHRDITEALGYDYGGGDYSGSLVQFMSEGNIRIVPEMNGINLSVKPTKAQEQALSDYISRARGEVVLDIDDLNGYTVVSVEYPRGTYHAKVLNDIREWFDNGKQPETSGLSAFRSLTKKGVPQKRYGNYHIYGKDVRYEAPMQEQVAPVEEVKAETQKPVALPDEFAPIPEAEANAMQSENIAHIDDADVPPEMEAPYYGETQDAAPIDPFEDRDMKEVSRDRKTPAYMYENPEVKPFFQAEANILLGELERVEKPETIYNGWAKYEMSYEFAQDIPEVYRTERIASDTIVYLRDTIGMSYADIEKGLKAIIEDHGAENIAAAKKLEFVINDRLLYGYNDDGGFEIPANQDYINLLTEKQISEYSEEARKQFFDVADDFAPITEDEIAPVAATTEETSEVPVKEQYEAIKPERKKSTEPRLKRVKDSETSADGKQRKWIGTSTDSEAVDGKVTPDDIPDDMRYYQPIPNKVTLGNANTRLDSMGYDASLAYFNSQFANKRVSLDDIALGERLIQEAVKRGDTKTASELIQNVSILGTELGQKVQALSIIKRLSPEGQLRMLQKTVERGKTRGDRSFEGVEITQEMIDHILKTYGKDGTYDQTKLNEAVEDVKKQIADQMKVTKLEKVNAWRYLSMLGNPKTHIRNLVSNVAMQGTVAVKNAVARTIETIAPIENRTKTWKRASDAVKTFSQKTALEMKDVLSDGGKYSEEASIKEKRDTFKNKVLNKVYNFNSDMLSKEDWWFSKPAFTNALSEYLTANGIVTEQDIANNPKIVAKAKQYATEQSQIATFRQYSWLANKINEIEHRNVVTNIAVGAILPFKKTPINIAKTGLNYSPLGFAKTLTYDAVQVKNGKMEASELVDHLSQNITGSALTLVGYLLASSGFLNGAGEDDKEGEYDYQLGEQAYSITIGDATYSLSWLSPIAMPLFVGANAYEQLVEGKEWNGDVVVQTLAQTLDPLSEMSFLSSLDSVLSSYDSGIMKFAGIAQTAAQSYTTQFVPTLLSQVAAVMDDTKRTTKVAGDSTFKAFDEIINNLKYKIPGLRETLEPTTDIWGNEVKQTEDMLTRAFETFIAPYSKREDIATEIDSEIKSLYGMTGDDGLIPSIPNNYVNYKDEKYKMSAKEYTAYKEAYGQTAYNLLGELFDTETYRYASDEDKAEMVNKVYDYARDVAKQEFLANKGVKYTNAKEDGEDIYREDNIKGAIEHDMTLDEYTFYHEYPEKYALAKSVGGYEKYKTYSSELYDIKADKDENGKTITGSRKEKVADYINNLDIPYEEKIILFKSEYNADDTYNYEIIDYLNNRNDISYDEMVAILRELGFTVKGDTITWD